LFIEELFHWRDRTLGGTFKGSLFGVGINTALLLSYTAQPLIIQGFLLGGTSSSAMVNALSNCTWNQEPQKLLTPISTIK